METDNIKINVNNSNFTKTKKKEPKYREDQYIVSHKGKTTRAERQLLKKEKRRILKKSKKELGVNNAWGEVLKFSREIESFWKIIYKLRRNIEIEETWKYLTPNEANDFFALVKLVERDDKRFKEEFEIIKKSHAKKKASVDDIEDYDFIMAVMEKYWIFNQYIQGCFTGTIAQLDNLIKLGVIRKLKLNDSNKDKEDREHISLEEAERVAKEIRDELLKAKEAAKLKEASEKASEVISLEDKVSEVNSEVKPLEEGVNHE